MTRFIPYARIERLAEDRVREFESRFGQIASPPIPIERLIDEVFDLGVLWEPISTSAGLSPVAALRPGERCIVVNEARRDELEANPPFLHFALGHELGHWDLHVDHAALAHPLLPGIEAQGPFQRHRTPQGDVTVLLGRLHAHGFGKSEAYRAIKEAYKDLDDPIEARQVNRYAAALLMPSGLLERHAAGRDLLRWGALYELAGQFSVSITAMKIRLETLGWIYVDEHGAIHRSRAEAHGQTRLI